jgi:F-type H+-transporting ATPase subunit a
LFIILKKKEKKRRKLLVTAFFFILFINIISLYPQVFSPTSQLAVTVPLSILFWISLMLFGWINNTSFMLSHLLPHGTPIILAVFIIFIELVRNIIRPITLSIRLAANLIAGHLLLIIISNTLVYISIYVSLLCFPINLLLTALELIVSFIQSYVFLILVTLYINETE